MHRIIKASTASRLYAAVLDNVLRSEDGECVGPRGMATRELRNQVYVLTDTTKCAAWLPDRRLNYPFMFAEFLWVFCGRSDVAMIRHYNSNIVKYSDDGQTFYGAYGPRWRSQIGGVVERIRNDADTRQAIIGVWRPEYNIVQRDYDSLENRSEDVGYTTTKDVPCTLTMQYMFRQGRLEATVSMRSSDAWLGIPYDIFNFAMLQRAVAAELQVEAGPLTLVIGSSHIYERDADQAGWVLNIDNQCYVEVDIPGPPNIKSEGIAATEYALRQGAVASAPDGWQAFASMLGYRTWKDPIVVHSQLLPLITGIVP